MKILKYIRKNLYLLSIILLIIIIFVSRITYNNLQKKNIKTITTTSTLELKDSSTKLQEDIVSQEKYIYVDIKGSVQTPGVYKMLEGSRVNDLITLAGGLIEEADTSLINLAKKLIDEMVIIIYTKDEVKNSSTTLKVIESVCNCPNITNDACLNNFISNNNDEIDAIENTSKVSLNTATTKELQTLNGIGNSKALAIIDYRNEYGPFEAIEDIMNVPGIGQAVFDKIKENITL